MQMNSYLHFNGNCEAALKFYEDCLGGKIAGMFRYSGTPAEQQVPLEWRDKVLHASIKFGDGVLMGSDVPPGYYEQPKGFSVSVSVADPTEAERIFHALEANGTVKMPIQETFWATRFGMLVDQFGIPWMINCEKVA